MTILAYRDKIVIGTVAEAVQIGKANINLSLRFKTASGSHTFLEHSKLGHKPRMLKGNPPPPNTQWDPSKLIWPFTLHLQDGRLSAERPCP